MSQFARLSIWENDPLQMNWYDHVIGRKTPAEPFLTPNMTMGNVKEEQMSWTNEDCHELAYQDIWFNELTSRDGKQHGGTRTNNEAPMNTVVHYPLHGREKMRLPCDPYFEYLFADAGLENGTGHSDNSIDDLSFGKESGDDDYPMSMDLEPNAPLFPLELVPGTPELESAEPQVIDVSPSFESESGETGVRVFTEDTHDTLNSTVNDSIDNINSACNDVVCGNLTVSFQQANVGFFGTSATSQIQNHLQIPLPSPSTEVIGFHNQYEIPASAIFTFGNEQLFHHDECVRNRRVLKPKSPRAKIGRLNGGAAHKHDISCTAVQKDKAPIRGTVKGTNKRPASILLDGTDKLIADGNSLRTKKTRLFPDHEDSSRFNKNRASPAVSQSFFSDSTTTTSRQASADFFNHEPLAVAPKGYAGQFDGMVIKHNFIADFKFNLTSLDRYKSGIHCTFGDRRHPNGMFTHTSIVIDPLHATPDFTQQELPHGHPLFTCMDFATDMTDAAAHTNVVKLRSHDEEILRRESHIECAHARLEGVAVGYYRYYQGHLNIEEYHDAEMCIC